MKLKYTHTLHILIIISVFITTISLSSCKKTTNTQTTDNFEDCANDLFIDIVSNDGLTLNYALNNPKKYGIKEFPATFGAIPLTAEDEYFKNADKILTKLTKYKYNNLTTQEQYAYDTISWHYNNILKSKEFIYYNEYLRKTTDIQIQLPILFNLFLFITS